MVIRVLDHVTHCSSYAEGDVIFTIISPHIQEGEDVTLSFEGVDAVPSSFVNAAIIRLVEVVSLNEIKAHLKVINSTRQINDLIRSRVAFLSNPLSVPPPHPHLP
ncbi:MAG: STAS-like domain-containing protein [Burkholderiales bacterium]